MKSSSGSWLDFAKSVHAVPIFGTRFGNLLLPSSTNIPQELQACGRLSPLPRDQDYLAVRMSVIYRLCKEDIKHRTTASNPPNSLQLGHSTYWLDPGATLSPCLCDGRVCQISVARLSSEPGRYVKAIPLQDLFEKNTKAAVIFPCKSNRLRKSPPVDSPLLSKRPAIIGQIHELDTEPSLGNVAVTRSLSDASTGQDATTGAGTEVEPCLPEDNPIDDTKEVDSGFSPADLLLIPEAWRPNPLRLEAVTGSENA